MRKKFFLSISLLYFIGLAAQPKNTKKLQLVVLGTSALKHGQIKPQTPCGAGAASKQKKSSYKSIGTQTDPTPNENLTNAISLLKKIDAHLEKQKRP